MIKQNGYSTLRGMLEGARQNDQLAQLKNLYSKRYRAKYRHAIGRPKGNLYHAVRMLRGISQTEAGKLIGITQKAWQYRERVKVMYWPLEIAILQQLSGLSNEDFIRLLNDIA